MSRDSRRTLITAADHRYARTLAQLLLSAERHGAPASCTVIAVDLGLAPADRDRLAARFPWCRVEPFNFDRHPPHVRRLAVCAWKPIAIDDVVEREGGLVLWLDSATVIRAPLDAAFDQIARDGVLALTGQSPIRRWCHEATLRFMAVAGEDAAARCRPAGVVGVDAAHPVARALVRDWRRFALIPECIDPPGASRANHRYDQAILSNLLAPLLRTGALALPDDEIDISSVNPVRWIATRQTVPAWMPLALDPIVRAYYRAYKATDRAILKHARARGSTARQ